MDTVIFLLITMAFSAFFSGMEIAFVSVDKLRFEMERKSGVTSSIISYFLRNPNNFISTMLVGNNIALVIYGILMAQIIEVNLLAGIISNHFVMVLVQTVISTLIILVTGEFLPKTLFKINPNLMLRVCAIIHMLCHSVSCFKVCIGIVVSVPSDIWDESKQGGVGQGFWQSGFGLLHPVEHRECGK